MHSLIFKRTDSPKNSIMENNVSMKELEKLEFPVEGEVDPPRHALIPTVPAEEYCQPCHLPSLSRHLPHASTCSYGIQALLHKVHRGYATDGDRTPDQTMSFAHERDEFSQQHESEILREWKKKKEDELQERKKESQAKLDHILEQAALERENFYKERDALIEAKKKWNREREAQYHAEVGAKQQEQRQGGNLWEAVAALLDLHGDGDGVGRGKAAASGGTATKHGNSLSPKSMAMAGEHQLSTPKKQDASSKGRTPNYVPKPTKKPTDLSRMREVENVKKHASSLG